MWSVTNVNWFKVTFISETVKVFYSCCDPRRRLNESWLLMKSNCDMILSKFLFYWLFWPLIFIKYKFYQEFIILNLSGRKDSFIWGDCTLQFISPPSSLVYKEITLFVLSRWPLLAENPREATKEGKVCFNSRWHCCVGPMGDRTV